jgi:hypothetical protein
MQRKIQILTSLLAMLEEEELYWYKTSHENWLHKGDNNIEYFHRIANGRKRKNTILSFSSDNGVIAGDDNLLRHATEYYKNLFGPGEGNALPIDPDLWGATEKVTTEDNHVLTKPFSEEEIKEALFQMEKNTSIPVEFYQSCWEIIKKDIIEMFADFHQGKLEVTMGYHLTS